VIRYLEGQLQEKKDRSVVVLVNGIGYEVELSVPTRRAVQGKADDERVGLHVSYQQSANQPVPRLYGFLHQLERDFFEELLRVNDVGPSIALSAMSAPVNQIARAIVDRDVKSLRSIKGIGEKVADKIIAELKSRVAKYALLPDDAAGLPEEAGDYRSEVRETLTKQLGFKPQEAQRLIDQALKQNPSIASSEDLFDEVLKLHK